MDLRTVSCSINELERSLQCQRNDVTNKKQMLIKMKDDFQKHFQCLIDLVETDYQQLASNGDSACCKYIFILIMNERRRILYIRNLIFNFKNVKLF